VAGVGAQDFDSAAVQGDAASACGALRWAGHERPSAGGELLGDGELAVVEIDVDPAQSGGFASA
jgi:hypothetical protein